MGVIAGVIGEQGAVVDVWVGVSEAFKEDLRRRGCPVPDWECVPAIVDTGSALTGFRRSVYDKLGIEPYTTMKILTPSTRPDNPHETAIRDVGLFVQSGLQRLRFKGLAAFECEDFDETGPQAILGRDFLKECRFEFNGIDATFRLSF